MSKRKMQAEFVEESTKVHGGFYTYEKAIYILNREAVCITCPAHGDFRQTPDAHKSGGGCSVCADERVSKASLDKAARKFAAEATNKHSGKYSYDNFIYAGARIRGLITCPIHGDFPQRPNHHLGGSGCAKCGFEKNNRVQQLKKDKASSEFVEDATKKHGGLYAYENFVYEGANTPGYITCRSHGDFLQTPANHKSGQGCAACANEENGKRISKKASQEFIRVVTKKHSGKYAYDNFIYDGYKVPGNITCPIHGDFLLTPESHKAGNGCKKCGKLNAGKTQRDKAASEFSEIATKKHDGFYSYNNFEYVNSKKQSYITCPIHGDFLQTPTEHKSGCGCPLCSKHGYSKMAVRWMDGLSKENGIFIQHAENGGEHRILGTRFFADGYCKETNTVYEFHGDNWHGNVSRYGHEETIHPFDKSKTVKQLYEETLARENKIKALGYNLVTIWESEYKNQ
jgi:hypothetical protein